MAQVTMKQLMKTYPNGYQAIQPIDLTITDGEFLVLVGPSGCGKSTLLRMIAGLESISGGELKIDDRRVNEQEPADRDIAMVFQNYALYPHMTVYQNMAYGLKNRRVPKTQISAQVTEAAKLLELDGLLSRKPKQLSGGQRQRVAMGRAIVRQPKVFLFDEPLSNLDAKLRVHMRLAIRQLQRQFQTTSVYVTHDQVEAMTMADRIVVLNQGRIEQVGSPIELYQRPATEFVATFIGSPAMNLLPVILTGRELLLPNGRKMALPLGGRELHGPAKLGIRAEDVELVASGQGIELTVAMVEPLGADTLIYTNMSGIDANFVIRQSGYCQYQTGDRLAVKWPAAAMHLFDAQGQRLNPGSLMFSDHRVDEERSTRKVVINELGS